jgi:hypothetical protein
VDWGNEEWPSLIAGGRARSLPTTSSAWGPRKPHSAAGPKTGYTLSHALFPADLGTHHRRFAVAETLSHLERLVVLGRAARTDDGGCVAYTQP